MSDDVHSDGTDAVAGFERRLAARAIDAIIGLVVGAIMIVVFVKAGLMEAPETDGPGVRGALLVGLAGMVAYNTVAVALGGATLGKLYCELQVKTDELGACTWGEAFVREAFAVVDGALLPLTYFVMRGSKRHQRWGDRFAGTVVVRVTKGAPASAGRGRRVGIAASLVVAFAAGGEAADVLARAQETASCDRPQDAEFRDVCLARLAVKRKKPDLCERSADSHGREECYAHLGPGLGEAWCEKVDTRDLRERCYMTSAHDAALCAKIVTSDRLREQCISRVAAATHDPRLCDPLKILRESCVVALGPIQRNDACVSFTTPGSRDACYLQHAMCDLIEAPPVRDHCYVVNPHGGADCAKVVSPVAQAACFTAAATTAQDPSVCDKIGASADNQARRVCYSGSYSKTASPAICARFTDSVTIQDCFSVAASVAHDASLCAKVTDPAEKKDCLLHAKP